LSAIVLDGGGSASKKRVKSCKNRAKSFKNRGKKSKKMKIFQFLD
jgi:hypothetical protein